MLRAHDLRGVEEAEVEEVEAVAEKSANKINFS
jgi:hypothetical protein